MRTSVLFIQVVVLLQDDMDTKLSGHLFICTELAEIRLGEGSVCVCVYDCVCVCVCVCARVCA